jgi:hypothetical protein
MINIDTRYSLYDYKIFLFNQIIIYVMNAMPMNIVFILLDIIYNDSNKNKIKDLF